MASHEWRVPRPSGVISSRDLARNTSKIARAQREGSTTELSEETENDETLEVLGLLNGLDLNHSHRILETLSDGDEWVPDAIATAAGVGGLMVLLGFLEIRLLSFGASATTGSARKAWRFWRPCKTLETMRTLENRGRRRVRRPGAKLSGPRSGRTFHGPLHRGEMRTNRCTAACSGSNTDRTGWQDE
jgi:hypothetical protein